ncbi:MAG: ABC transporter ATP-binding protein [Eubacteriales bacterium]
MSQSVISFKNYQFQYNAQAKPTLYNINLEIKQGEKVLIIGASGSGKSTITNCLNGLIPFRYEGESIGSLTIDGYETKTKSIFQLSKMVGTVLQDPDGQFIGLTVGEDIAFAAENDCKRHVEMVPLVKHVALQTNTKELLESAPFELSGGQKQRVSLAGIMVDQVKIFLFDEPLANLDPATGKQTIELIDKIKKDTNATMVIIEHRLEDVLHKDVDRIILMSNGRIVANKTTPELLASDLLIKHGIREPFYITALKYAKVVLTATMESDKIDSLMLHEVHKERVRNWFEQFDRPIEQKEYEPLLEVQNIYFGYEIGKLNLKDVSFTVGKGEMISIVGKNGAGKSTLSKLICGFEKVNAGRIVLEGVDLEPMSIRERAKRIGYVMQNPNQMISKNLIYDEIALGLLNSDLTPEEKEERIEKVMKVCGIYSFRKWPISALSFGQKKRVTIASVLVLDPDVIILDEPTAGQDFKHYTEIMEFLTQLHRQGITIILVTHDMHLMLEYTNRALVFADGKLLASTTPAELLCSEEWTNVASLKQTSLFQLANLCEIDNPVEFVQRFIEYDREVRSNG